MKNPGVFFNQVLFLICAVLMADNIFADQCPSVKDITYRLISKDYEWTVDEGITLDDLLSVRELFEVSIENSGEFVSCKYKNNEMVLKLDGLPIKEKCPLINTSNGWFTTDTNRLVCDEKDLALCLFNTNCTTENN